MNLSYQPSRGPRRASLTITALALMVAAAAVLGALTSGAGARAQSGWAVTSFTATYTVQADGTVDVEEAIVVDFGSLERHGIFRDLFERVPCGLPPLPDEPQPLYPCPSGSDRVYRYLGMEVTDGAGRGVETDISHESGRMRVRIGDPDVIVSGVQTYRLSYRIEGALNAFDDHDELYWNITGPWPEATLEKVSVTVSLPRGAVTGAICYEGYQSTATCPATAQGTTASFSSSRDLYANEELTVAVAWPRGIVDVPPPLTQDRPSIDDYFELDPVEFGGAGVVGVLALMGVAGAWWRHGRDRRYRSLFYLTNDPREHTRPLFARDPIVVEYTPPDGLRPGQMGVILDEAADTLDVTATVVDLGVRGYLHITEIPKKGWFGKTDWKLTKTRVDEEGLQPYERTVFSGLFDDGDEALLSGLKNKFYKDLARAQDQLYKDAAERKWFPRSPSTARALWIGAGVAVVAAGVGFTLASGAIAGRALIGMPVIPGGLLLMAISRTMARRTAAGSEALRRVLGFRLYVATAETRRQEFNEQRNILNDFARYLPYAMVFGCVDKWAKALEGLDDQVDQAVSGWYTGAAGFHAVSFASGMHSFSSSVGSTISSSPGSSGGSGFGGGGGSGGGGGGGGGGSW